MENERGLRSTDVSVTGFVPFKKDRSANIGKFSQLLKYLGPAFIVSVAYIDPGNFAN